MAEPPTARAGHRALAPLGSEQRSDAEPVEGANLAALRASTAPFFLRA